MRESCNFTSVMKKRLCVNFVHVHHRMSPAQSHCYDDKYPEFPTKQINSLVNKQTIFFCLFGFFFLKKK